MLTAAFRIHLVAKEKKVTGSLGYKREMIELFLISLFENKYTVFWIRKHFKFCVM